MANRQDQLLPKNTSETIPDLAVLKNYFEEFQKLAKDKNFRENFEKYLEDNQKYLNEDEREIFYKIVSNERTANNKEKNSGFYIILNLNKFFPVLERMIKNEITKEAGENRTALDYILKTDSKTIFNLTNKLAKPGLANPGIKKYLIGQFQEFVRAKEAGKVAKIKEEASVSPVNIVNVAFNVAANSEVIQTNSNYSPTNTPPIGLAGANVGRNNLKPFQNSLEAITLQAQINKLSQSGMSFYESNIAARDIAYLENQRLAKEKLEAEKLEAQRIEAAKIEEQVKIEKQIADLKARLQELRGESPSQIDQSPSQTHLTENPTTSLQTQIQSISIPQPTPEAKKPIDFNKVYPEIFARFAESLNLYNYDYMSFIRFVVDSINDDQNPDSEFKASQLSIWQEKNGNLNNKYISAIIEILQENYNFTILVNPNELGFPLNCSKSLFNWVKSLINNPKSIQLQAKLSHKENLDKPRHLTKEALIEAKESLFINEVLVIDRDLCKTLGEIIHEKYPQIPANTLNALMDLQTKTNNREVHNNYITAWSESLGIKTETANDIIKILYPVITGKEPIQQEPSQKTRQIYKEMFNEIKDSLGVVDSQLASLHLKKTPQTESTHNFLVGKGIKIERYGFIDSKPVCIFPHPMIERIRNSRSLAN